MEIKNSFWITCALDFTLYLLGLVLQTLVVPWLALLLQLQEVLHSNPPTGWAFRRFSPGTPASSAVHRYVVNF